MKKGHWINVLHGVLGVIFGVLLIIWPIKSLVFITWLIGAYLLLHSIILIVYGFLLPKNEHRGLTILHGIIGIIVGVIIMSGTVTVLEILVFFFALWSLAAGIIEIVSAFFRKEEDEELNGLQIFGGLFAILIAILLFVYPVESVAIVQIIVGLAVLAAGLSTTIHSLKKRT